MQADFQAIRDGLKRLREARSVKVFGSQAHKFQVNPPLPEAAVTAFERKCRVFQSGEWRSDRPGLFDEYETRPAEQVRLPQEYRDFLILVGNGGAGPAYGLFPLGEMDSGPWQEGDSWVGWLGLPFPHSGPWNDLSGEPELDEEREPDEAWEDEYARQLTAWENQHYWHTDHVNGAIPICHLGCAVRQWLVVTGPEAGYVWNDNRTDHAGLSPLQEGGQGRVTFLDWYRSLLDKALRQLED